MLFAILDLWDMMFIFAVVCCFSGGVAAYIRPADRRRMIRLEHKLDLVMTHLGLDYTSPPLAAWQKLAENPARKIEAIKAYREENACGLAEAKRAVEDYIQGVRSPADPGIPPSPPS